MSKCSSPAEMTNREFLERLNREAINRCVPLTGSFELTSRCNLRCVHCYLGKSDMPGRNSVPEVSTERWLELLEEITRAGCLNLIVTGGEPFLRQDFPEIYRRAKELGLLVTVFTNGTLIHDGHCQLFSHLPPVLVEISVYGASRETYEAVTGVNGSFERCLAGIERLHRHGIRFQLKTMLLRQNLGELDAMEQMARKYDVRFRFDGAVNPRLNGDQEVLQYRLSPHEIVRREMADPERKREWTEFLERYADSGSSRRLYTCNAGVTSFYVDASGLLKPCLMVERPVISLAENNFATGWDRIVRHMKTLLAGPEYPCNDCEKRFTCGSCPAFFELETGKAGQCCEFVCEMGRLRYQALTSSMSSGGVSN